MVEGWGVMVGWDNGVRWWDGIDRMMSLDGEMMR